LSGDSGANDNLSSCDAISKVAEDAVPYLKSWKMVNTGFVIYLIKYVPQGENHDSKQN